MKGLFSYPEKNMPLVMNKYHSIFKWVFSNGSLAFNFKLEKNRGKEFA